MAQSTLGLPPAQPITSDEVRELRTDMRALQSSITDLNTRLSRLEGAK